jgi:hypothetical protein
MFRHRGVILRDLEQQRYKSQPAEWHLTTETCRSLRTSCVLYEEVHWLDNISTVNT